MKRQHYNMKFWNWGPTSIWHNIESVAFFSKPLHPTEQWPVRKFDFSDIFFCNSVYRNISTTKTIRSTVFVLSRTSGCFGSLIFVLTYSTYLLTGLDMRVEKDLPISYASMLKSLAGVNRMKMKRMGRLSWSLKL